MRSFCAIGFVIYLLCSLLPNPALASWPVNGVRLSTSVVSQKYPKMVSDGSGGAIVMWTEYRSGDYDIYMQRVDASGNPQWAADGVALRILSHYDAMLLVLVTDGAGGAIVTWTDRRVMDYASIYAQRVGNVATGVEDTPSITGLAVLQNYPNPFTATAEFRVWIPVDTDITVDIFDVAGRRVGRVGAKGAASGWNRISLTGRDDAGRRLPSGVYFYRVLAGGEELTRKMVITR